MQATVQQLSDGTLVLRSNDENIALAAITCDGCIYENSQKRCLKTTALVNTFWSHYAPNTFVSEVRSHDFFAALYTAQKCLSKGENNESTGR